VSKPCPNPACLVDVTKDGGCDHMCCKACGTHFCWRCLRPMNSNSGFFCSCSPVMRLTPARLAATAAAAAAAEDGKGRDSGESGGDGSVGRLGGQEAAQEALRRRMEQTASFDPAAAERFVRGQPRRVGPEEAAVVDYAKRFLRGGGGGGGHIGRGGSNGLSGGREPTSGDLEGLRRAVLGLEASRVYRAALEGFLRRLRALVDEGLETGDDGAMGVP
jgi:hypothetical protein